MHLLAYGIDVNSADLKPFLAKNKEEYAVFGFIGDKNFRIKKTLYFQGKMAIISTLLK